VASASSDAGLPTSSMIIYVDNQNKYLVYANSLNTTLSLSSGPHSAVVKSWDSAGHLYSGTVQFTSVAGQPSGGGGNGVSVSSPTSGATLGNSAHFVASAASPDQNPITAMMIYVDNQAQYTVYANHLDTYVNLGNGNHNAVVKAWNAAGALFTQTVPFSVGGSSAPPPPPSGGSGGNTITNIQQLSGWNSCSRCAGAGSNIPIAQYSMTQYVGSPSLTGSAAHFWLGGSSPYANAIWWKNLSAGSNATHFTYDLYFYIDNAAAAEALEFDFNLSYNGRYYVFGTQCSPLWSHNWDTWDMNAGSWNHTGISCPTFPAYTWNHVTLQFERTWDNKLHFVSIAMNGDQHYVDRYVDSQGTGYSNGVSVDFQMDGNSRQTDYSVWLDRVNLSYY
jgi:hypothetical protein